MRIRLIYLVSTAVAVMTTTSLFAQNVVPAVSLGDPIPVFEHDPNVKLMSGFSGVGCKSCGDAAKGCTNCGGKETIVSVPCPNGDCGKAPACAVCAKPAPCKACEVPKLFHKHSDCTTCSTPTPCPKCAAPAPAPAPCTTCEVKKHVHVQPVPCTTCAPAPKPAPCTTCAPAPKVVPCATCSAPAPCKAETKPCDPCAKAAPAPCDTCKSSDPCKAHAAHAPHSHPILDSIKNLFTSHHAAPAAEGCSTCAAAAKQSGAVVAMPIPTNAVPGVVSQPVSYRPQTESTSPSTVPAALAPYAPPAPFSTSGANHDR